MTAPRFPFPLTMTPPPTPSRPPSPGRARRAGRLLRPALALYLVGCAGITGGGAFNARFPDNQEEPTRRVVRSLPDAVSPEATEAQALAVGTTGDDDDDRAVVAFDLQQGQQLWSTPLPAMTRPEILGDVVVTSTREEVVGLDLASGSVLWRRPTEGLAFVGASRARDVIAFVGNVGASGGEVRESRVAAVDARTGGGRWDHQISAVLGRPAARGAYFFIPWDRQNIAVLDATSGDELVRLRSTDDVIDWVEAGPAGVFYGSQGIYRLTEDTWKGTREDAVYREPPIPDAPRDPLVEADAFFPEPGMRSARGKIRIYHEPRPGPGALGEPIAVVGDTYYFVYFRYVYAFDGANRLRWATMLPDTIVSAQPLEEGFLVVTESGAARVLGLGDGAEVWSQELGTELASLSLSADSFDPAGVSAPQLPGGGAPGGRTPDGLPADEGDGGEAGEGGEGDDGEPKAGDDVAAAGDDAAEAATDDPSEAVADAAAGEPTAASAEPASIVAPGADPAEVQRSLVRLATDPDNRLVPGRAYAISLLARLEAPEITRELLDLYAQRSMPSALRDAIVEALKTRKSGSEYLVAALDQRYDFLDGTQSPPLSLIVPSLIESNATQAVPGLVRQLEDHETPIGVLPLLVEAVAVLGGEAAQPTIRRFLTLYRADSTFGEDPRALIEASDAVFETPGEDGRDYLQALAAKTTTLEPVRAHIDALFRAEAERAANAGFEEVAEAEAETTRLQEALLAGRPEKLTQAQIQAEFAGNADILRECIMEEIERDPKLGQVRFVFIIDADGIPHDFAITPPTDAFVNCVEPVVRDFRYPEVKQKRQFATVTLQIRSGDDAQLEQDAQECGENDPWWTCYRAVDATGQSLEVAVSSDAQPWWTEREPPSWYVPTSELRRRAVAGAGIDDDCPPEMPNCAAGRSQTEADGEQTAGAGSGDTGEGDDAEAGEETPWWLDAAGGDEGGEAEAQGESAGE